jgi:hypothetical protein
VRPAGHAAARGQAAAPARASRLSLCTWHAGACLFKALSRVTHASAPATSTSPPRRHARRAAMPAAWTSSASTRPAGRSAFPAPHLGPKEAHSPAPCPAPPFPSPDGQPQRATPPRSAEGHHRRCFRQFPATKSGPDELAVVPHRFPGQERRRTRRNPATRAAGRPRGLNCESPKLPRGFHAKQGPTCKKTETSKVPGAKMKTSIVDPNC